MPFDLLDLYARGSDWAVDKVACGSDNLTVPTPCDDWDLRTLLDHMLETQRYFAASARGEEVSPPGPQPQPIVSENPGRDFQQARREVLDTFGEPGAQDKTGPALGIAFSDLLLHGWDVARATGQEATMPTGLAEAAYSLVHGKFSEEERVSVFKHEIEVGADATSQQRLLAYTGRRPD